MWTCNECTQENEDEDELCVACDEPRPQAAAPEEGGRFACYAVGRVLSVSDVPGKKLKSLSVDVGLAEPLTIVTSASNATEGAHLVVAKVGASVQTADGETVVKKASVGGVVSEGMLCDAPMLGWTGGGAGAAALVPSSFAPGSAPPEKRPRMDGK